VAVRAMRPSGVPNRDPEMMEKCFVYHKGRMSERDQKMIEEEDDRSGKIVGKHIMKYEKTKSNFPMERKNVSLQFILD
jgi:hypothetical protein